MNIAQSSKCCYLNFIEPDSITTTGLYGARFIGISGGWADAHQCGVQLLNADSSYACLVECHEIMLFPIYNIMIDYEFVIASVLFVDAEQEGDMTSSIYLRAPR